MGTNIEPEWWGWKLPETKRIVLSFDHLTHLLAPEGMVRVPGSSVKVPGEVRGRARTLQTIIRSSIFSPRSRYDREIIKSHLRNMKEPLESFLARDEVAVLFGGAGGGGEAGRELGLRRRRDALDRQRKERILVLIGELEGRIEGELKAIEDVVWPRKVIQLSLRPKEFKEVSRLELILKWATELGEELWGYVLLGWMWGLIFLVLTAMGFLGLKYGFSDRCHWQCEMFQSL